MSWCIRTSVDIPCVQWYAINIMEDKVIIISDLQSFSKAYVHQLSSIEEDSICLYVIILYICNLFYSAQTCLIFLSEMMYIYKPPEYVDITRFSQLVPWKHESVGRVFQGTSWENRVMYFGLYEHKRVFLFIIHPT